VKIDIFKNPGAKYGAVHLWMLNDKLDPEEVKRQVRILSESGCRALITRTYYGLNTEYLSSAYMEAMECAINEAEKCGIEIFLQAGYMPNGFPGLTSDMCGYGLEARPITDPITNMVCLDRDDRYYYVVRPFNHAIDLLNEDAVRTYVLKAYQDTWRCFSRHFGKTITSIWVDEPSFHPPILPWSHGLPAAFRDMWGYDITSHIPSLFHHTDNYKLHRHHFWRTVVELLAKGYFQTVSAWCADHGLLFSGHLMGEDTLTDQIALTGATMPLYKYMHLPGIDHLGGSLCWTHGASGGEGGLPFILTPKQCTSVVNQLGKGVALAEMYGVSTQALTMKDQQRIGDFLALLGINQRCLHASFYSMRGRRKRLHAPNLSYQQPWWQDVNIISRYFARLSYLLRQGRYEAEVLVIHPIESAYMLYEPLRYREDITKREPMPELEEMNSHLVTLSKHLLELGLGFDYADESMLAEYGRIDDQDNFYLGNMRYRVIILPQLITLRRSTVDFLNELAKKGYRIMSTASSLPSFVEGQPSVLPEQLLSSIIQVLNTKDDLAKALIPALNANAPGYPANPDLNGHSGIWLHRRYLDDKDELLFACNVHEQETKQLALNVVKGAVVEQLNLVDGSVQPLSIEENRDLSKCTICIPPESSVMLHITQKAHLDLPSKEVRMGDYTKKQVVLPDCWRMERLSPNALPLDYCRLIVDSQYVSSAVPTLAVQDFLSSKGYKGDVTLEYSFSVRDKPANIHLVLEEADLWRVTINKHECRYAGEPYYLDRSFLPIDISPYVNLGLNIIRLTRYFEPLRRAQFTLSGLFENLSGVELENAYIIGDFAVTGTISPREQQQRCLRLAPDFRLEVEKKDVQGDLVLSGLPFFAGTVELSQNINLDKPMYGEKIMVGINESSFCTVELLINDVSLGVQGIPPFTWDITKYVTGGNLKLSFRITNTLRNLLGPHHRTSGEPDHCWGEKAFKGYSLKEFTKDGALFLKHEPETETWTDDYFVIPFKLGFVTLTYS